MKWLAIAKSKEDEIIKIIIFTLALVGIGVMYSASHYSAERDFDDPAFFLKRQFLWLIAGFIVFFIISKVDFLVWESMSLYFCLVSIFLLILVFIPGIGKSVGTFYGRNFNRWIGIGPFQIQPSEFSKITVIIYLAAIFKDISLQSNFNWKKMITPVILVGSILLLIILEPSFGTTMEILFVIFGLVFISGFSMRRLFLLGFSLIPLVYVLIDRVGYRRKRIDIWLDPYSYRYEEGHQLVSSYQAFQSGGWIGNDISSGYSHRYLPYAYTDFIVSPFFEDYGMIGFLIFWGLIVFFIVRTFMLLERVNDRFGFYLGSGIISVLAIQFLMNLFVVTGLLPVTGVSLPFFSYGGSSLITVFILCGILVNITRRENLES
ncbi:FtsW/RodA/SpoVE family cell cycle protein [Leptospira sp. GIMC2001]|uniref:FtsW/RodA/SpoVE family cell cycle protein n=1 Tax=Leptospira sp. GIMC2001 TaxID=1513297 RepID=UPI00234A5E42|nr:putative peptidoglycan glycosyltransferase FtsW [Leptospira sp. GIMC2001]WCL47984.1 putative peptidoglycan glycosyltransferase FtsW [Leptospira sp. GIMC2001]